jgi:hypothetical protein
MNANANEMTAQQVMKFLEMLESFGDLALAARKAGLNAKTMRKFRKDDADFDEMCRTAMAGFTESQTLEPVFKKGKRGVLVRRDGRLLELLMKIESKV